MKWIGAAMLALTLGACDAAQEFTSPGGDVTTLESQRFVEFERSVLDAARAAGITSERPAVEVFFSVGDPDTEWVVVEGDVGDQSVEAVIGAAGGELRIGRHWLMVPSGTVASPTRFTMTPVEDGTMHVDLTATSVSSSVQNDVGAAGFSQPVYLSFAVDPTTFDPTTMAVAWLVEGSLVVQQSFVYENDSVVGALNHFSGYVLVAN
ncbi:MAG TPA: hypothetical protein VF039_08510 [Longimicrobiales bacterium]